MIPFMPITRSAKKRIRNSATKQGFNLRRKKAMKTIVKDISKMVEDKNVKDAEAKLALAYKAIDKAAKGGVIKKNTAARKKSRLAKRIVKAKLGK